LKRIFLLTVVMATVSAVAMAQSTVRKEGTIVRMRMTDCMPADHGFMAMMSGGSPARVDTGTQCPEYVLVTDNVVYAISGKTSDELLPLAESTNFRLLKNEMLIRVDDSTKESHFRIKAMMMRPEWERSQTLQVAEANPMSNRAVDSAATRNQQ
jgi:hypothetical protein